MAQSRPTQILLRAASALPFLLVAVWCFSTMDPETIIAVSQPAADAGFIEWDGGKVKMLDKFYGVAALDETLYGAMASFSPSTFGYDSISSWQFFHFMVDMGPILAAWLFESSRAANAWTPAYFPTIFAVLGQLAGFGTIMPVFCFLCIAFGPSAADLAKVSRAQLRCRNTTFVVPVIILFHTSVVMAMFLSQDPAARHYWTWASQLSPLWIGLGNMVACQVVQQLRLNDSSFMAPKQTLGLLSLVSAGVWIYTVLFSPHSLATLFIPGAGPQAGLILHMRKALQADEIGVVISVFLWLAYFFLNPHVINLVGSGWFLYVILAPITILCVGPGATFALGWYLRGRILETTGKP